MGFDTYGFPTSIVTGTVQNYSFNFNPVTGNLAWRQNNKYTGLREDFQYDNSDRLLSVTKSGVTTLAMSYDENTGGLTGKSDAGSFTYDAFEKPYAIKSIDPTTGLTPDSTQTIVYTSFNKVESISENGYEADFIYGSDDQRSRMIVKQDGNTILTRWYPTGSYLKETSGGVTKEYTFIGGDAYTAPVAAITQGGTTTYYNLLRDHLGSITQVISSSGSVVAEYSYDAWGRMRNPATWTNYEPGSEPALMIAGRGYTGHEHLPWFNTINMNGRLYDPLTGMFLNPDNYIQSGENSQSFNRYSYCLNNPLRYFDPTGMYMVTAQEAYIKAKEKGYDRSFAYFMGDYMSQYWELWFDNLSTEGGGSSSKSLSMTFSYYGGHYENGTHSKVGYSELLGYYFPIEVVWVSNKFTSFVTIDVGNFGVSYNSNFQGQGGRFPLDERINSYLEYPCRFGDPRDGGSRKHGGADLYAPVGTNVYAVKGGTVIQNPYKFYRGSYAIEINHGNFVARYSEINVASRLRAGSIIIQGQLIGTVADLSLNKSMLHFEMYSGNATGPLTNRGNLPYMRRSDLINPTHFLNFGY